MKSATIIAPAVLVAALALHCASAPGVGSAAQPFEAVDGDGVTVTSLDLSGKVTVLYFWAVWCAPCVESSPEIQKLYERYKDVEQVRILGVHYDNRGDAIGHQARNGFTYPIVPDGRSVVAAYGIRKIPTVVILSPDGEVLLSEVGFGEDDYVRLAAVVEKEVRRLGGTNVVPPGSEPRP